MCVGGGEGAAGFSYHFLIFLYKQLKVKLVTEHTNHYKREAELTNLIEHHGEDMNFSCRIGFNSTDRMQCNSRNTVAVTVCHCC